MAIKGTQKNRIYMCVLPRRRRSGGAQGGKLGWGEGCGYIARHEFQDRKPPVQRLPLFSTLVACLISALLLHSCDEAESVLGGTPGGQVIAFTDSVDVTRLSAFHLPQSMVAAARQTVGRSDSLGLESVLLFRLDYTPFEAWTDVPEASPTVHLSFKMDHSQGLAWFPQLTDQPHDLGESARYLDLELILLRDSVGYEDVGWENYFSGPDLTLAVLDRVQFRVSSADTAFGDDEDPLTGRRTYREVPGSWFQHADTTARWLMLRAVGSQQGFVPLLAAGYTSLLRPGLRFSSLQVDSVLVDNVAVPDTSWDTTFVAATWQTSLVRDTAHPPVPSLSTGWAGQVFTVLPPFPPYPAGQDSSLFDPLTSTLAEAWLKVPLTGASFNLAGTKVNLYAVAPGDSLGVDVDTDQLVSSDFADDSTQVLTFNVTSYLRRVWVEDDTLRNTEPIPMVLKIDDYNLLQLRQLRLAEGAGQGPRLVYSLSQAPSGWVRP